MSGVLRSAGGRLRLPAPSPASRSRPGPATSGATRRCCRCPTDIEHEPEHRARLHPAAAGPTTSAASSASTNLWVKDDSTNPTNSFKDRVVACALSAAREFGCKVFACPSTGNLANAVAAAGARAGIKTVVFIPRDLEQPKQVNSAVYTETWSPSTATTTTSTGSPPRSRARRRAGRSSTSTSGPFYAEGSKTLGYEIAEQLGWRLPDQIVIPVASGSQLTKVDKAFGELIKLGLVEDKPYRVFGAQADRLLPGGRCLQGRARRRSAR